MGTAMGLLLIIGLFIGPYVVTWVCAWYLARVIFDKFQQVYADKISRFFLAASIFIIIEFPIRKIVLFVLGMLMGSSFTGEGGNLLGIIGFVVGPYLFWGLNGLLLLIVIRFAFSSLRRSNLIVEQQERHWSRAGLIVLIFLAILVLTIPRIYAQWFYLSEPVGNFLASKTHQTVFCKMIVRQDSKQQCILTTAGITNVTAVDDCELLIGNDFTRCIVAKAERLNDPKHCLQLKKTYLMGLSECLRPFVGSREWQTLCNSIQNTSNSGFLVRSRCLTSSNVNNIHPTVGGIRKEPAWFWSVIRDSRSTDKIYVGDDTAHAIRTWLTSIGVNANLTDSDGRTILIAAVARQSYGLTETEAKELIEFGVDASRKDNQGLTALDYAIKNGNTTVAAYLQTLQEK